MTIIALEFAIQAVCSEITNSMDCASLLAGHDVNICHYMQKYPVSIHEEMISSKLSIELIVKLVTSWHSIFS